MALVSIESGTFSLKRAHRPKEKNALLYMVKKS